MQTGIEFEPPVRHFREIKPCAPVRDIAHNVLGMQAQHRRDAEIAVQAGKSGQPHEYSNQHGWTRVTDIRDGAQVSKKLQEDFGSVRYL